MKSTPIPQEIVDKLKKESGLASIGKSSIREIKKLISQIEKESGISFIKMEMGIPGLPPVQAGTEAEIEALRRGVAALYPDIEGIPELKAEASRFVLFQP
jgi:aspartate/methionine/tyrosine aminotransferase